MKKTKSRLTIHLLIVALTAMSLLAACSPSVTSESETATIPNVGTDETAVSKDASDPVKSDKIARSHRVYYEIFVRSFADSNGDGIGDLNGIKSKLPELKYLGIEGLWLTPIFKSPSYHKYDVTDYLKIDEEYGTTEDLKNLVQAAHEIDIKVIIDFPVNHTGVEHPWFQDVKNNPQSRYRDYYNIIAEGTPGYNTKLKVLGGNSWHKLRDKEYYYGVFWEGMPDLNFTNTEVRSKICEYGKHWLQETGLDGYRLDAAMHTFAKGEHAKDSLKPQDENMRWWQEFRTEMQSVKEDVYLVGEVWSHPSIFAKFFQVFDSTFNFEFSEKLVQKAVLSQDAELLGSGMEKLYKRFSEVNPDFIDAPFLSNHDQKRLAGSIKEPERLKLVASILLTLPGNPFIYYGEELGMQGYKPDEYIRQCYPWKDGAQTSWVEWRNNENLRDYTVQKDDPNSLLNHYKKWIQIRKDNAEIRYGSYEWLDVSEKGVFAFKMIYKDSEKIVFHNLKNGPVTISYDGQTIALEPYQSIAK